ncbi:hypothetical protein CQW23_24469 [Capsicum baccatum]|uniref:Uncharacterized protein n=1 Tax=Capsicum baccatum TaxID=33114 RepID=A0A2G2VUU7_CAPBA|nr:hypothetical protein CQW23_24469 [Capsicum baccatum]
MDDVSIIMMASSICSLILDLTSEEALLNHPDFISGNISSLSKLIERSFGMCGQDLISDDAKAEVDLFQIITSVNAVVTACHYQLSPPSTNHPQFLIHNQGRAYMEEHGFT